MTPPWPASPWDEPTTGGKNLLFLPFVLERSDSVSFFSGLVLMDGTGVLLVDFDSVVSLAELCGIIFLCLTESIKSKLFSS